MGVNADTAPANRLDLRAHPNAGFAFLNTLRHRFCALSRNHPPTRNAE
jgi:hypothetical protein